MQEEKEEEDDEMEETGPGGDESELLYADHEKRVPSGLRFGWNAAGYAADMFPHRY